MSEELSDACESGDVGTVHACLARGEDVNARNCIDKTPLMTAVWNNQLEIVRILLVRDDLDIAVTDGVGWLTALHYACMYGRADCVPLLGTDRRMTSDIINMKNIYGDTALMMAVKFGHSSCVKRMEELDGVD